MPAIKRKFNYGHVVLSDLFEHNNKALCGNTVPVLLRNGEEKNLPFGGFVSAAFGQRVKVLDIIAWAEGDGWSDWHDLPTDCWILGQFVKGRVFIVYPVVYYFRKGGERA